MKKTIVCKDGTGRQLTIGHEFPLFLFEATGIFETHYSVLSVKGFNQDGAWYTGATSDVRNIVLTIQLKNDFEYWRSALFDFFQPRAAGTLEYHEGPVARQVDYRVESVTAPSFGGVRLYTVSLLCMDPLFYDINETRVVLAGKRGLIRFPVTIKNPFKVAERVGLAQPIYNPLNAPLGMRAVFTARGAVTGPQLLNLGTGKTFQVNITMAKGDVLEVVTGQGMRQALLTKGGSVTDAVGSVQYPPNWPMLAPGPNTYSAGATSGVGALDAEIFYKQGYWGC